MKLLSNKLRKGSALMMAAAFFLTLSLGACSNKKSEDKEEATETEQVMEEKATEEHPAHEGEHPSTDSTSTASDSTEATGSEHPSN